MLEHFNLLRLSRFRVYQIKEPVCSFVIYLKDHILDPVAEGTAERIGCVGGWRPIQHNWLLVWGQ